MMFNDEVSREIDRRKLEEVIVNGVMTRDEIMNAPIVVICPNCEFEADVDNDVCSRCKERYDG